MWRVWSCVKSVEEGRGGWRVWRGTKVVESMEECGGYGGV